VSAGWRVPPRVRYRILLFDSFTCQYCGRSAPEACLEVDHMVPVAGGGGDEPWNLITACEDCNMGKLDHPLPEHLLLRLQARRGGIEAFAAAGGFANEPRFERARYAANAGRATVDYGERLGAMIREVARREGRSVSNLLRTILRQHLETWHPDLAAELNGRAASAA
jgi:HNH endonuclease